jgi:hypothetical protein
MFAAFIAKSAFCNEDILKKVTPATIHVSELFMKFCFRELRYEHQANNRI